MEQGRDPEPFTEKSRSPPQALAATRRRLIASLVVALGGGIAGCGSEGDAAPTTTTDGSRPSTTSTRTPAPSPTPTPTRTGTTTTEDQPDTSTTTPHHTTVQYERAMVSSPSSAVGPRDGFAGTAWLAERAPAIHRVTTLAGEGPGSFRAALEAEGHRLVVFEVSGVIDLAGNGITVDTDGLYVAGQTAPDPGITVIRGGIQVDATNVVIQHFRVRPGDQIPGPTDALSAGESGQNVIFDHCSATWGTDEVMSTGGSTANDSVTFSNNIIAEGLSHSIHPKGEHSKGSLVMNDAKRVALIGNLLADNRARNPRLKGGTSSIVVNNHVYHYANAITMGGDSTEGPTSSVVGNRWERGPEKRVIEDATEPENEARVYIEDNAVVPFSAPMTGEGITVVDAKPVWPESEIQPIAADDVMTHSFETVGARPANRTHHDQRILDQILNQTETYIDSQSEVGGYPALSAETRSLKVPDAGDGLATWLYQHTRAVELPDADPP